MFGKKAKPKRSADTGPLKELYQLYKKDVVSIAIAKAKDFEAAFVCLERTFRKIIRKAGSMRDPERHREFLLRTALKEAGRVKKGTGLSSRLLSSDESDFLQKLFTELGDKPLAAWVLRSVIGLGFEDVSYVTSSSMDQSEAYLREAEERLRRIFPDFSSGEAAKRYAGILEKLSDAKEVWGNISFYAEKRRKEAAATAVGILLILAIAVFGAREAALVIKASCIPAYSRADAVMTEFPDSPTYWENAVTEPDEAYPSVNKSLMDALQGLPDDAAVLVDFKFYDREIMLRVTEEGYDLESLYTELFENGEDAAAVNRAISLGILEYYRSYEIPWMPERRHEDFVSPYKSIYECTIKRLSDLSGNPKYARETAAIENHPEIFGDEESFDSYMYSMRFISEAPVFYGLLAAEYEMKAYLSHEAELSEEAAEELRLRYETEIFAFYHRTGGQYEPSDTCATYEELKSYFIIRERMAEKLREELENACKAVEGVADLESEYRTAYDISAFSAKVTKSRILELAKTDARFKFYGVALDRPEGYPANMENELAMQLALEKEPGAQYTIYRVDDKYAAFNTNYWVPYRLPEGFIEDLRERIPCEGTAFEFQVGYHYTNGVGHKKVFTRLQLLRDMYLHPDSFYYSYNNYFMDDA